MLAFVNYLVIVVVSFIVNGVLTKLNPDDPCTTTNEIKGICKFATECQSAHDDIKKGIFPTVCGFQGLKTMVCCTDSGSLSKPRPPITTTTKKYIYTNVTLGARAAETCRLFYPNEIDQSLILGGRNADVGEFRHMALIGFGEEGDIQWLCGGSLVSLQFVMTAAHCLFSLEFGVPKWVLLGDLDISTNTDRSEPQQILIKNIIPHPEYKEPSKNHDIALLELETPAVWTKYVAPACLDTKRNHNETQMIATGWGKTSFMGDSSNHLLKTNVDVVSVDLCRDFFKYIDKSELPNGIDDDLHICAGGRRNDTCLGDSGGPLQIVDEKLMLEQVYTIVGVTSFGKACGLSDSPGVYTRVNSHLAWLEQTIWPSE